jgi:outer membrane protein OmpA-like peptidoglycan-associated protein
MIEHKDFELLLIGYADKQTGTDAVNQRVSAARAKAVKDFLVKSGVATERIDAEYKGATEQPFAENDKNRVVICSLQ